MSKTNCAWHFDRTLLKENHFFSTCVTVGENSTINILRSGERISRLFGGSLLIRMKRSRQAADLGKSNLK